MIGVKRPASVFADSSVKNSDRSSIPVSDQLDEIFKMSRGEEHEDKGFESIDSVLEACPKKSKVGMKYELHSDSQRIRLMYQIIVHGMGPNELSEFYNQLQHSEKHPEFVLETEGRDVQARTYVLWHK